MPIWYWILYEILRRLLVPAQSTCPEEEPSQARSSQEGRLVFDPTIDAWEHTGFYPQGYNPPQIRDASHLAGTVAPPVPQFGNSSVSSNTLSASTVSATLFAGTAFSRPWQPGYPAPRQAGCMATDGVRPPNDPWAAPEGLLSISVFLFFLLHSRTSDQALSVIEV